MLRANSDGNVGRGGVAKIYQFVVYSEGELMFIFIVFAEIWCSGIRTTLSSAGHTCSRAIQSMLFA